MSAYIPCKKDAERVKTCIRAGIVDIERISRIVNISVRNLEANYPYELGYTNDEDLALVADTAFEMATSGKFPHMTQFWLKVKGGVAWRETETEAPSIGAPIVIVMKGDSATIAK